MADQSDSGIYRPNDGRGRANAPSGSSNPVAELVRRIGYNDPFADFSQRETRNPAISPDWHAEHSGREAHSPPGHPSAQQADALNFDVHSYRAHAGDGSDAYRSAAHAHRDGGADGIYEHDEFGMERRELYYDRTRARRRGRPITVMAVVALALIGTAGAFGYRAMSGGSRPAIQPPAAKADKETSKVGPRMDDPRIAFPPSNPPDAPQSTAGVATSPSPAATPPAEPAAVDMNEPKKSAAQRPTRIAAAPNPPAQATSAGARESYVQVSSLRSETDAQASFKALQGRYPKVLGEKRAVIRRAELGGKGVYYRAMVGPFASVEQAAELCSNLIAAGGQCVVQRH
jgi:hypothetical protein